MERVMELGIAVLIVTLSFVGFAVWRIGRVASWRAVAMTARATGSLRECVSFLRFCARHS